MEFTVDSVLVVSVILALGELWKHLGLNTKFIPIPNMILGILGAVFYIEVPELKYAILQGLIIGLTASGFFSSGKNLIEGFKGE